MGNGEMAGGEMGKGASAAMAGAVNMASKAKAGGMKGVSTGGGKAWQ